MQIHFTCPNCKVPIVLDMEQFATSTVGAHDNGQHRQTICPSCGSIISGNQIDLIKQACVNIAQSKTAKSSYFNTSNNQTLETCIEYKIVD